jgi:hypothetical protein
LIEDEGVSGIADCPPVLRLVDIYTGGGGWLPAPVNANESRSNVRQRDAFIDDRPKVRP